MFNETEEKKATPENNEINSGEFSPDITICDLSEDFPVIEELLDISQESVYETTAEEMEMETVNNICTITRDTHQEENLDMHDEEEGQEEEGQEEEDKSFNYNKLQLIKKELTNTPHSMVSGKIGCHNFKFLVDTGATVTIINWHVFQGINENLNSNFLSTKNLQLTAANGGNLDYKD